MTGETGEDQAIQMPGMTMTRTGKGRAHAMTCTCKWQGHAKTPECKGNVTSIEKWEERQHMDTCQGRAILMTCVEQFSPEMPGHDRTVCCAYRTI